MCKYYKLMTTLAVTCGVVGLGTVGVMNAHHVSADNISSSSAAASSIGTAANGVITLNKNYRPVVQSFQPKVDQNLIKTLDDKLYSVELKRQYNASSMPQGKTLTIHVMAPDGATSAINSGLSFTVSSQDQFNKVLTDLMNAGYQPGVYQHQDNNGKVEYTGLMLHSPSVMVQIKDQSGKVLGYQAIYNTATNGNSNINLLGYLTKTNPAINIPFNNVYNSSVITYQGTDGKTYKAPFVSSNFKDGMLYGLNNTSTTDSTLTFDMKNNPFEQLYLRSYEVTVQSPQQASSSSSSSVSGQNDQTSVSVKGSSGKDVAVVPISSSNSNENSSSSNVSASSKVDSSSAKSDASKDSSSDSHASSQASSVKLSNGETATAVSSSNANTRQQRDANGTVKDVNDNQADANNANDSQKAKKDKSSDSSSSSSKSDASTSSSSDTNSDNNGDNGTDSNSDSTDSSSSSDVSSSSSSQMPQTGEAIAKHPILSICVAGVVVIACIGVVWIVNRKHDDSKQK